MSLGHSQKAVSPEDEQLDGVEKRPSGNDGVSYTASEPTIFSLVMWRTYVVHVSRRTSLAKMRIIVVRNTSECVLR